MSETIIGASLWEQEVYDQLRRHVESEEDVLRSYRELADGAGSEDVAYAGNVTMSASGCSGP